MVKLLILALLPAALACPLPDFDAWDRVIKAHVRPGEREGIALHLVDYQGIGEDPDFGQFVSSLAGLNTSCLSRNATYATFMNAYNALAIKMVIDHPCKFSILHKCEGPIASITDIGVKIFGPASSVWLKDAGVIGGKAFSLQAIEDFLRSPAPFSEDARLHACIVCASISCPNVRMEAFRPEVIDAQMSAQLSDMLNNTKKGMLLDRGSFELSLSKIFSWYGKDFVTAAGSVLDFILPYVPCISDRDFLFANKQKIQLTYFKYNWNTNGVAPCNCTNPAP